MATPTDVSKLSLEDLDLLIRDATKRRDELIDEKRQGLLAELAKLDALTGKSSPEPKASKSRTILHTHVHPKNGHNWIGRGGVPKEWRDIITPDMTKEQRASELAKYRKPV